MKRSTVVDVVQLMMIVTREMVLGEKAMEASDNVPREKLASISEAQALKIQQNCSNESMKLK